MTKDVVANAGTEPQPGVAADQFCELAIHVGFNQLPIVSYPNDGESKESVKYGPPFLRFPVNLSPEDATILENILGSAAITFVGFEVKDRDGNPRTYRTIVAR